MDNDPKTFDFVSALILVVMVGIIAGLLIECGAVDIGLEWLHSHLA